LLESKLGKRLIYEVVLKEMPARESPTVIKATVTLQTRRANLTIVTWLRETVT
jgi:hypothetical protein